MNGFYQSSNFYKGRSGYNPELIGLGIKEFVNYKLINIVDIYAPFNRTHK
ncbi:hypothetical protein GCM10009347_40730 [Shewanella algicola]|nr:hypothetical protein GCM10009347_40730 [Shewanella algicola]|tara:strand:- start:3279 stop:3428 length:150 start_codon:yes stop_codon:yes gene_type:complete